MSGEPKMETFVKIKSNGMVYYIPDTHSVVTIDNPKADDLLLAADLVLENNKILKNRDGKI